MNNFASIDQNRLATAKQIWAASCHCSSLHAATPSERFGLNKVFHAILNKFYDDQDAKMTHGDVQNIFEHDVVPAHFVSLIKKPKASKKAKVKVKATLSKQDQTVEEAIENIDSKKVIKPVAKVANNSVAKKMDKRIIALETKVSEVDSKLDAILAILQK
tara:strand:- start:46 stop:525 length:480 start_codon:yes stop_codon:yes gene_type:complete